MPLFVGTRLWGRCDPPCRPGWGWRVPGAPYPHLPFHGLWIDWSRFPLLDELALVSAPSHEAAEDVLKRALKPFHDQVACGAGVGGVCCRLSTCSSLYFSHTSLHIFPCSGKHSKCFSFRLRYSGNIIALSLRYTFLPPRSTLH